MDYSPIFLKVLHVFCTAVRYSRTTMPDQFPVFEIALNKRGRTWRWRVCTTTETVVMQGSEKNRRAAKYQADRALFLLLLSAPYQSIRLSNPEGVGHSRSRRSCPRASPQTYPFGALRNQAGPAKST